MQVDIIKMDGHEQEFIAQLSSKVRELNFKLEDRFENNAVGFSSIIKWKQVKDGTVGRQKKKKKDDIIVMSHEVFPTLQKKFNLDQNIIIATREKRRE
jgi:hypothetical protein